MAGAGGVTSTHDTGGFIIVIGLRTVGGLPKTNPRVRIRGFGRWLGRFGTGIATTTRRRFVVMRATVKDFPNDCFPKLVLLGATMTWVLVSCFRIRRRGDGSD